MQNIENKIIEVFASKNEKYGYKQIAAKLHIYDKGPHGIGFGAAFPQTVGWPEVLGDWLENSI